MLTRPSPEKDTIGWMVGDPSARRVNRNARVWRARNAATSSGIVITSLLRAPPDRRARPFLSRRSLERNPRPTSNDRRRGLALARAAPDAAARAPRGPA